jgi:hypothetical protein
VVESASASASATAVSYASTTDMGAVEMGGQVKVMFALM